MRLRFIAAALVTALLAAQAWADHVVEVVAPTTVTRTSGQPTTQVLTFAGHGSSCTVHIVSPAPGLTSAATSCDVWLNGTSIATPDAFDASGTDLSVVTDIQDENRLEVRLRGAPGDTVEVSVECACEDVEVLPPTGWSLLQDEYGQSSYGVSSAFGGSYFMTISGAPDAASFTQELGTDVHVGDVVTFRFAHTDLGNFSGQRVYFGDRQIHYNADTRSSEPTGTAYEVQWIADDEYPAATVVTWYASIWPGTATYWFLGATVSCGDGGVEPPPVTSYVEENVRLRLLDAQLGGVIEFYRARIDDDPSDLETVLRWDAGVRVVNAAEFERTIVDGIGWLVVYAGTTTRVDAADIVLSTD